MKIIRDILLESINTDKAFNLRDDARIKRNYERLHGDHKLIVDDIFISFCGYSLETLIRKSEEKNE
jgi:hypothetical protein